VSTWQFRGWNLLYLKSVKFSLLVRRHVALANPVESTCHSFAAGPFSLTLRHRAGWKSTSFQLTFTHSAFRPPSIHVYRPNAACGLQWLGFYQRAALLDLCVTNTPECSDTLYVHEAGRQDVPARQCYRPAVADVSSGAAVNVSDDDAWLQDCEAKPKTVLRLGRILEFPQMHCVGRTYRAVNTLRLGCKNQSVNSVQWNNRCLFSDPHKT
jgi:hypothetical protein